MRRQATTCIRLPGKSFPSTGCPVRSARRAGSRGADFGEYDLIIGMDRENLHNMHRICAGGDSSKIHLLMDFTDRPGDVADPWYTRDFEATWRDVYDGCRALLEKLR